MRKPILALSGESVRTYVIHVQTNNKVIPPLHINSNVLYIVLAIFVYFQIFVYLTVLGLNCGIRIQLQLVNLVAACGFQFPDQGSKPSLLLYWEHSLSHQGNPLYLLALLHNVLL